MASSTASGALRVLLEMASMSDTPEEGGNRGRCGSWPRKRRALFARGVASASSSRRFGLGPIDGQGTSELGRGVVAPIFGAGQRDALDPSLGLAGGSHTDACLAGSRDPFGLKVPIEGSRWSIECMWAEFGESLVSLVSLLQITKKLTQVSNGGNQTHQTHPMLVMRRFFRSAI